MSVKTGEVILLRLHREALRVSLGEQAIELGRSRQAVWELERREERGERIRPSTRRRYLDALTACAGRRAVGALARQLEAEAELEDLSEVLRGDV